MLKGEIELIKELLKDSSDGVNKLDEITLFQVSEKLDIIINQYQENLK